MPVAFILSKLAETIASPSALLLLAPTLGIALLIAGRARIGLALLVLPVAALLVLAILPVDDWLLAPLEDRFPPLRTLPAGVVGVIALGGAVDPELTEDRGMPSLNGAAERMTALVALGLAHPGLALAFTGGSGRVIRGHLAEADVARMLFDQLGLAGRAITYEGRSRTTIENAVDLAAILHPTGNQTWVLLTSAMHMPRAMAAFRAAGWHVLADPVGYKTAPDLRVELAPSWPERLQGVDAAAHEWIGLAVDRLVGRTGRLLPAP